MKLKDAAKIYWSLVVVSAPLISYSEVALSFVAYSFLGWALLFPLYWLIGAPWWD